jgi:hypothetical protein
MTHTHSVGLIEISTSHQTPFTRVRHPCRRRDFFFLSRFSFFFDPFFVLLNPSCHFMFHTNPYTTNTTQTSMPTSGIFFACPGFFPFDSFFVLFKSFRPSCHLHSILPSLQQTQTSMPPVGFEPTSPASKRPQTTHALDRASTGISDVEAKYYRWQ